MSCIKINLFVIYNNLNNIQFYNNMSINNFINC